MSEQSKKVMILGVFLAIMLMAGGVYAKFMMLDPTVNKWGDEVTTIKEEIVVLEDELQELVELEDRRADIESIRSQVDDKSRRLPTEDQVPNIINIVRSMLRATRVDFISFTPMAANQRLHYKEKPVEITCQASFHMFGQFVNMIEVSPDRIMRIKEFEIKINEERPDLHEIDMTVAAYVVTKK